MPLLFLLLTFLTHCTVPAQDTVLEGKVIRVADGDTITVLDSLNHTVKVRLYGIDCPERGQDFSNVAKRFTSGLCYQKKVRVVIKDVDQYGRTVGIVYFSDSVQVNLALLEAGLAWHYTRYDQSEAFAQAEEQARLSKKGLWAQANAQAPWQYRQRSRSYH